MAGDQQSWSVIASLRDIQRAEKHFDLEPDAAMRARVARSLNLVELPRLSAQVDVIPWLDGAELNGRWRATVVQTCGVRLEPFETTLEGDFQVRCVPASSPLAIAPETEGEIDISVEADDPPDVLETDSIDVAGYVVEHLALEIDPFPRKPGAAFEPPPAETPPSPFAVLARLKRGADEEPKS